MAGAGSERRWREQSARFNFIYSFVRYFQSFVVMQHNIFGPTSDLDKRSRIDIGLSKSKVNVSIKTGSHLNLYLHT